MKELVPMDDFGIFVDKKDTARVDSRFVAEMFEKRHDSVLRDIRELDCSPDFRLHNYVESSYKNAQKRKQPCYVMTRDGFMFLVMGYRGKKAAAIKEAYIKRFNEMEAFIIDLVAARVECPALTTNIKLLYGEDAPGYRYANEFNMIDRIVVGVSAKDYRKAHGIADKQSIRPYLTLAELKDIRALQNMDCGLLLAVPDYQERKQILKNYKKTVLNKQNLLDEGTV